MAPHHHNTTTPDLTPTPPPTNPSLPSLDPHTTVQPVVGLFGDVEIVPTYGNCSVLERGYRAYMGEVVVLHATIRGLSLQCFDPTIPCSSRRIGRLWRRLHDLLGPAGPHARPDRPQVLVACFFLVVFGSFNSPGQASFLICLPACPCPADKAPGNYLVTLSYCRHIEPCCDNCSSMSKNITVSS